MKIKGEGEGGVQRVGRIEKNSDEYIATPKAARLFGLKREYAARLAKEAYDRGDPYPVKRGRPYEAPIWAWEIILNPESKVKRKKRKIKTPVKKDPQDQEPDTGISCSKAARRFGISPSWAARLSRRARKRGDKWPKWEGGQLIAPYREWVRIFEDESLRVKRIR